MRFTVASISLALAAGSASALTCGDLTNGKLTVVNGASATGLGLSPVVDAAGDAYLQKNADPTLFTFQPCDSTYMGFDGTSVVDGKQHANGRYVLNGKCLTRESDNTIALKPCSTTDDASLINQFFSVFWSGSNPTGTGTTRLLGGSADNYPSIMYTDFPVTNGNNIVKQVTAAPASGSAFSLRFTVFPTED